MRKKLKRICAVLMTIIICFTTTDMTAFATHNMQENAQEEIIIATDDELLSDSFVSVEESEMKDKIKEEGVQSDWDGTTTEVVYMAENFQVTFLLTGYWEGGYNATITIKNIGESVIDNWCLSYDFGNAITNIWNAQIHSQDTGKYVIANVGWNADIAVGESIEFGFSGNENFHGFPVEYNLVGEIVEAAEEDYTIEYHVDSEWENGFTGTISITNNTDYPIEDWIIEFDFKRNITEIWNGEIAEQDKGHYVIKNLGYNANILSNQTIVIGFCGEGGSTSDVPAGYVLCTSEIELTDFVVLEDGKIDRNYLERAIYPHLLMNNLSVDNVKLADDYDGDGLTLEQEYVYDTNPFSSDTDEDGLTDDKEISVYGTNPIKRDTDNDGMGDGTEVSCGLNPLLKDSDGNGIIDAQETVTQPVRLDIIEKYELNDVDTLPFVNITGKGDYSQRLQAIAIKHGENILGIDCLVGTPFEFVHNEEMSFESSNLSFAISDAVLQRYALEDLSIAWFNEDENALELINTTYNYESKTISGEVTHYSKYMVVSVPDYFFNIDWKNSNSIIESGKADVVFVVDTTGSMDSEIQNVKNNIDNFVEELEANKIDIRLGLVEYRDIYADGVGSTKSYDWYTSVSTFKEKVAELEVGGGGGDGPESVVDALYCAREMEYRSGVKKYIILLTDADYKNGISIDSSATLSEEIAKLVESKIITSVVTKSNYYSTYKQLVEITDGIKADIDQNFAIALKPLIEKMDKQVNEGCWIRLSDGSVVSLDKDPTLGDETVDTDKDGIPDIIELKANYTVTAYNPYLNEVQKIDTWSFYSHPGREDTDGDGLLDIDDLQPTVYDSVVLEENSTYIVFNTGRIWHKIKCTSYDYLDNYMQWVDLHVDNPIPIEEFRVISKNVLANGEQDFSLEELFYISLINNEGSKLYMNDMSALARESVFQMLTDRESRYYRHTGIWWNENWEEVAADTESGFFKGTVLSEADINLSWKLYTVCDIYSVLTFVAKAGALVIALITVEKVAPVVIANIQTLIYYVKTFGVVQGLQMYRNLGMQNLPDGVISWIQKDMADGDSSLDDLLDSNIPIYKRGETGEQALAAAFPGKPHEYYTTFVNGVKGGRYVDILSDGVAYEAKVGYTCLSQRVKMQILKDAYLISNKDIKSAVWVFYRSDITGRVGASPALLKFLEEHGIKYIINY